MSKNQMEIPRLCPSSIEAVKQEFKEGCFVVAVKDGCPNCARAKKILAEESKRKAVIEIACDPALDDLKVTQTPTVFYFKEGMSDKRIEPDGSITWHEFREQVRKLDSQ